MFPRLEKSIILEEGQLQSRRRSRTYDAQLTIPSPTIAGQNVRMNSTLLPHNVAKPGPAKRITQLGTGRSVPIPARCLPWENMFYSNSDL